MQQIIRIPQYTTNHVKYIIIILIYIYIIELYKYKPNIKIINPEIQL